MSQQFQNFNFNSLSSSHSSNEKDQYQVVTKNKKKIFNCLIPGCGKVFHFKSEIKRHLVIHSNTRPYVCDFPNCGKSFKRADALTNHSRLHGTSDPFHCPVPSCLSQFNTKAGLQYHLLKHGDEKIFKCNYSGCDKSFITYAQLKQHQKSSSYHKKINETSSPKESTSENHEELISTSDEMIFVEEECYDHNSLNFAPFDESKFVDFESEQNSDNYQDNYQESYEQTVQGNFVPDWEFASSPSQTFQEEIPPLKDNAQVVNAFPIPNMDSNLMSMLSTILRENQKLKEQLQQANDLLQTKSPERPQEANNFDADQFFEFSSNPTVQNWNIRNTSIYDPFDS